MRATVLSRLPCCLPIVVILTMALQTPAARAESADLRALCNTTESVAVLQEAPLVWRQSKAQAAWLDAAHIRLGAALNAADVTRWMLVHGPAALTRVQLGATLDAGVSALALNPLDAQSSEVRRLAARPSWGFTQAMGAGAVLALEASDAARMPALHRVPLALVGLDGQSTVRAFTRVQAAAALDEIYAAAQDLKDLGVTLDSGTQWRLWAPTARRVWVCHYPGPEAPSQGLWPAQFNPRDGSWHLHRPRNLRGSSYTYLVELFLPSVGWVRHRVTDPYSVSLNADSQRSLVADLQDADLAPPGWQGRARPAAPASAVDMMIYELHVRDFSAFDATVPPAHRGKYLAFTRETSAGMRHLRDLARAGLTDVHLLPIFDWATAPEEGCAVPDLPRLKAMPPDGEQQQALVKAAAAQDCFNWGYDPWHFNAPEGSFATQARDGRVRIRELRAMVMALQRMGLRVGMDVVYNHTAASGQHPKSVLDRIVPGYYHRLNAQGEVERSTCCDNTATEHRMMRKLMIDSAVLWAVHYGIDSFRFDLMGHQPREAMEALQRAVNAATGRHIPLIGEGWNFGEIANGARFVQASQLSLNGSGIGTFSDRMRDAARGGGHGDDARAMVARQGWLNGLFLQPNALSGPSSREELMRHADLLRVGLAGSLRRYRLLTHRGQLLPMEQIDYAGQPAGYVSEPHEVVNYVENHDNPTLFDINVFKLPLSTSARDRARVQVLGAALTAFSQGVMYWHAGQEILRSKSLDLNSFDSGDWFNRLDWSLQDNGFGSGLPPGESEAFWPQMRERLALASIKPDAQTIAWSKAAHLDLLRIRASSSLFRLRTAEEVSARLSFPHAGEQQNPAVVAAWLDGRGHPGARFDEIVYFLNADTREARLQIPQSRGRTLVLHPVHRDQQAADTSIREAARFDSELGVFFIPPRSAVVFVSP